MDVVELPGVRLHVLTVIPGVSGESDRVAREIAALDPAVILADLDTTAGLSALAAASDRARKFTPSFLDKLLATEVARRFERDGAAPEHPLVGAARAARNRRATFVAMRPATRGPGFFGRMRARRAAQDIEARDPRAYAAAFASAMQRARVADAAEDARRALGRVTSALTDGRAPILAVVQAHRAAAIISEVRALPRKVDV